MTADRDEQYEQAKRRVEAKKGFYVHALFYVVLNIVLLAAIGWAFLWVTVVWGLGLAMHGASVFYSGSDWVRRWEQRAIQKELDRQRDARAGNPRPAPAPPADGDATATTPTGPGTDATKKRT